MNSRAKQTLKTIVALEKQQDFPNGIPHRYLSKQLDIKPGDLIPVLEWLRQENYIYTHKVRKNLILVKLTEKGYQKARPWHTENRWRFVFAVVALLSTLVGIIFTLTKLIPDINEMTRPTAGDIVIDNATYWYPLPFPYQGSMFEPDQVVFPSDPMETIQNAQEPCLDNTDENCSTLVYSPTFPDTPYLQLNINNITADETILIQGLQITFVDYQEIDERIDILYQIPYGGGGGGWTYFDLSSFPLLVNPNPNLSISSIDPIDALGKNTLLQIDCQDNADCDQYITLEPEEIEGFRLNMPFIQQLNPGWYEFEAAIQFSRAGTEYITNAREKFDIIVPETVRPWVYDVLQDRQAIYPSIFEVDFRYGTLRNTISIPPVDSISGKLLFKSRLALDNAYYLWDFQTGEISHVGNYAWPMWTDAAFSPESSPSGWLKAIEVHEDPNFDIGIIDLENASRININNSSTMREIHPAWSPSGQQLAYTKFSIEDNAEMSAGDSDIFVYDHLTQTHTRITNTPKVLESSTTWIDENTIVYLMPESYFISWGANEKEINQQVGLGIIDLHTGKQKILTPTSFSENASIRYYEKIKHLVVHDISRYHIYTIDGQKVGEINMPSEYKFCHFLEVEPFQLLCWDNEGQIDMIGHSDDSPIKHFGSRKTTIFEKITRRLGWVQPDGFIILDLENNRIEQYAEDGTQIDVFDVPQLDQVFRWGAEEILFIPDA